MSELPTGAVSVLVLEMQRLRDEGERLTAELAERTKERDEALRCSRANRDLYGQATERGERAEKERDGLAATLTESINEIEDSNCYCSPSNTELCDRCAALERLEHPSAILAAHDAAITARSKAEGLREAKARLHSVIKDYGVNPYCDNTSLVRMVEVWRLELLAEEIETMAKRTEGGKDANGQN